MKEKSALELANSHWDWLETVLHQQRQMERKLFIDAFLHGYKHGVEDKEKTYQLATCQKLNNAKDTTA